MLKNYLKIAWKVLGRNKFFTFVSLFGISLTIGILLVLTTLFDNFTGAYYPEGNRARSLYVTDVKLTNEEGNSSWQEAASFHWLNDYVKKLKTPELIALASGNKLTNTFIGNHKLELNLKHTCENYWKVHTFQFLEGQGYQLKHIENRDYVAVITAATRDEYFGENQKVVGKNIEVDNTKYQVIGVVKNVSEARILAYSDIYAPHPTEKGDYKRKVFPGNYRGIIQAYSKADFPKIKAEYQAMIDRAEIPLPDEWMQKLQVMESKASTPIEIPADAIFGQEGPAVTKLYVALFIGIFIFMLLPALNLVNLNSSRILERSSEIGVRKAFGATSSTLAVQFVVENIILTLVGGMLGLLLAFCILEFIETRQLIRHVALDINLKVFLIALVLCLFFGILSGVLPAWRMSRIQIVNALKGQNL